MHINHTCFFATAEDVILRSAKHCILTELSTCSVHGVSSVTAQSHAPCKVAILTPCTWVSFTDCLRGRLRPIHNQGQFCGGGTTEIPFKATFEVTSLGQSQNQRTSEIRFSRAGHQWNANFESKASFQWKAKQVLGMRADCKPQNATTLLYRVFKKVANRMLLEPWCIRSISSNKHPLLRVILTRLQPELFFWSFSTKTSRDQTPPSHVHWKIWPHSV